MSQSSPAERAQETLDGLKDFDVDDVGAAIMHLYGWHDNLLGMNWGEVVDQLSGKQQVEVLEYLKTDIHPHDFGLPTAEEFKAEGSIFSAA